MLTRFGKITLILFCLVTGVTALPGQWDPTGDAKLFSYVFPYFDHYINDHCLFRSGSLWHLFFIDGTPRKGDWNRPGNEVRIGHATSPNLLTWTPHDSALGIGPPGSLDAAHVYAPSVVERNGTYYMFYTGNEVSFNYGEHLFLATSTDLYNWTRYQPEPIFAPHKSWAVYYPARPRKGSGGPYSGRDPFIFHDERYGYILYYVARVRTDSVGVPDGTYSCIAAATSPDLVNWTDRGPLLTRRTTDTNQWFTWTHPESPCLVLRNGIYYLFWKSGPGTRFAMSSDPLYFEGAEEHLLATSHASKVFEWNQKWYITSCSRDVDDIKHAVSDRKRGLFLAGIRWEGDLPRVVPLEHTARIPQLADRMDETGIWPSPVERGTTVSMRLLEGSPAGEHDVAVFDMQSRTVFRSRLTAAIDERGSRVVEIPTDGLTSGVYFVQAGARVARLVVL